VTDQVPLVADILPELAEQVELRLREHGEPFLAAQVADLRVTAVCRCGNEHCGSFYTAERPMKRWFRRGRQVDLSEGLPGSVTIDVVGGEIVYVEVLFWDEVRDAVARVSLPT
jgi:hypothetical protein